MVLDCTSLLVFVVSLVPVVACRRLCDSTSNTKGHLVDDRRRSSSRLVLGYYTNNADLDGLAHDAADFADGWRRFYLRTGHVCRVDPSPPHILVLHHIFPLRRRILLV